MEFRSIRQTSHISGANRNPGATEHDKAMVWDDNLKKIKYVSYSNLEANTRTSDGFVYKGTDSPASKYIWKLDANNNPFWRKEDFLVSVSRTLGGNSATFVMNDSANKVLPLGALAWLDSAPVVISLPGNTKVLFDDNNSIGGDSSFTFDNTNKLLNLTGFTGIQVKNNNDATLQGVFQYFGGNNLVLAHGVTRSLNWAANMSNTIRVGETAGGAVTDGNNNLFLGHYSASNASSNISGSVYIGNYTGRLETSNNRFYLGNTDYASLVDAKLGSLLWGDFSTGWLKVNNRLEVSQEVKVGTFNVSNTPTWGMLQFIGTGNTDEYKPQYFDGFLWQDFASGANYYLNTVTKATADVGTTSDDFKLTFDMIGIPDFTLQLGSNAFNSTVIPQASEDATAGLIQISSGDNTDSNRGFSHNTGLFWDDSNTELNIPGAIKIPNKARYSASGNVIISDGTHYYGRIGSNWIQLDNETTSGQANELRYDGSITGYDISLPKDGIYLPIKGIKSTDDRVFIIDNLVDNDLDFSWNIAFGGTNYTVLTPTLTSADVFAETIDPEGIEPQLKFRPLISSDDSVQFSITANNEIDISATGTGNPNIYQVSNYTGIGLFDDIGSSATDFKFKVLDGASHVTVEENIDGHSIDISVDDITLTDAGTGTPILSQGVTSFDFIQRTLTNGLATTVSTTGIDGIKIDVNKAIPKVSFSPTPGWVAGGTLGQGTIDLKAIYSADIRTVDNSAPISILNLKIGEGLFYDYPTNTLTSLSSVGSTTDYRLTSITYNENIATLHMTDEVGDGVEQTVDLTLPSVTQPTIATYSNNVDPVAGVVMINDSTINTPLGSYQPLTLNESTGELEFTVDPVLYSQQYELNDDTDNTKREFARANVRAAFINGDSAVDFNAETLTCTDVIADGSAQIQNVIISGTGVTTDDLVSYVDLYKRLDPLVSPSRIEVTSGGVNVYINQNQGTGNVNFYSVTDAGVQTRTMYLDSTGTLHIKGDIVAFDTTV